jgi:D-lactate dehydrogenase
VKICLYSTRSYDEDSFRAAAGADVEFLFLEDRLSPATAGLAAGCEAACLFVNDDGGAASLQALHEAGVRHVALRSAGFNHVDLEAAARLGMRVVRVPAYSPNAVAEHTIALILALNRRIHRAYNRVRDRNFSLDGLVGFDLKDKTVGVLGTGKIGGLVARLLWHFRCHVLAYDPYPDPKLAELGVVYTDLERIWAESDIISLNMPLLPQTRHIVNAETIEQMKRGVMIVNTGRGPLLDTAAVVEALKTGQIGSFAADVYEEEGALFFEDRSEEVLWDDTFARLLTFPNVLLTAHQAFLTNEALEAIATTTLANLADLAAGGPCPNEVRPPGT